MCIPLHLFLPHDIVQLILHYVGDDTVCQIPKRLVETVFPEEIIHQMYKHEKNQSLIVHYCKEYILYRTIELCINRMRKEQTICLREKKRKRKMIKIHVFFPKKTISRIEMFHNIISRSLFELENKDNSIHSPDYQSQFQAIFEKYNESLTNRLQFLSTNSTFTLLDIYYIRQCNVWINYVLQEQKSQSEEKYWSKYLYHDLLRDLKKIQKSLL